MTAGPVALLFELGVVVDDDVVEGFGVVVAGLVVTGVVVAGVVVTGVVVLVDEGVRVATGAVVLVDEEGVGVVALDPALVLPAG